MIFIIYMCSIIRYLAGVILICAVVWLGFFFLKQRFIRAEYECFLGGEDGWVGGSGGIVCFINKGTD